MTDPTPEEASGASPADAAPAGENGGSTENVESAPNEGGNEAAAGEDQDSADKKDGEVKAAPQAAEPAAERQASTTESEGEMVDLKLTPLDNQKQNIKDALEGNLPSPPPLQENGGAQTHHVQFADEPPPQSSLHQDEHAQYDAQGHNPRNHESALASSEPSSKASKLNPFKARKKNRLVPDGKGRKGHSHPRKSPYKSEVARLRHAQQLEREKRQFSPGADDASNASSSVKSLGIKDTTAPPETASFAIQSAKLKHSLLHSLGEFLTSAFADDEEASGSYFSQDLLDQLSESNPHLKGVWLQAKNLNDNHVKQLSEALIRNKVVTEVWLPSNQITDVGVAHLAHMLKFNRSIRELFLGDNDIGPRGAASLAGALARGNSTLVALGLGDNRIGVEGAGAFAAALRHNHTLHTLDVKNNGIPRGSSIRGLLNKMLEFNASDPGDESLVLGLQEELASLVAGLEADAAEEVVLKAEEALKEAMLCRRRGDRIGAAEAEGVFIRICTTGEAPVDPPDESEIKDSLSEMVGHGKAVKREELRPKKKRGDKPLEPDRTDDLEAEISTLQFNEGTEAANDEKAGGGDSEDKKEDGEPSKGEGEGEKSTSEEKAEVEGKDEGDKKAGAEEEDAGDAKTEDAAEQPPEASPDEEKE